VFALSGCTRDALEVTVKRLIRGEMLDLSQTFAPTAPELARAVREMGHSITRLQQLTARPDINPVAFLTIQARIDDARHRMAQEGRKYLCQAEGLPEAQHMAKTGAVPAGSLYSAILRAFYTAPQLEDKP
jgi:hypothetical protein